MFDLLPATPADLPEIELLLDAGFGPARHYRAAYRLRDDAVPDPGLSFVARAGAALVGSIQCWPIRLRAADGRLHPMTLLGPVASAASRRSEGIGSALVVAALIAADNLSERPVDPARLLLRWSGAALPTMGWVEGKNGLRRAA